MLKLKTIIKPDDAADAVAVGLTHLIFNQVLRK
jgi:Holliday junction resolvasome RuvABC endonuclease subunit